MIEIEGHDLIINISTLYRLQKVRLSVWQPAKQPTHCCAALICCWHRQLGVLNEIRRFLFSCAH